MATANYQHSKVFASLKNITEGLKENLTTSQYLQAYDDYIENAISPIIVSTRLFDSFLARLIGWQEKNFRRKVSFLDRKIVPSLTIHFLIQTSSEKRLEAYRNLSLDRGIRLEFLKLFYDKLDLYLKACNCKLALKGEKKPNLAYCTMVKQRIEQELKAKLPLISVYEESKFWYQHAIAFKQLILEKYVRMCLNEAQKDYVNYFDCKILLDDVIQVYLLAASRAIDKCDSKQGALTSHIKNWLLTGRSRVSEQIEKRTSVSHFENIDFDSDEYRASQLLSEIDISSTEDNSRVIRYLAKLSDPLGVARAYLSIEELLSEDEVKLLNGASYGSSIISKQPT